MTDFFRTLLEDCIEKLDEPVTQLTMLKLQLEQSNWRHQQQIEEIKHNYGMNPWRIYSYFNWPITDIFNRLSILCMLSFMLFNIYIFTISIKASLELL